MAIPDSEFEHDTGQERVDLPESIHSDQREVFLLLYRDRLHTALGNTGRMLSRLTTHAFNDSPSFHDGGDSNRDPATFKKPFDELLAFPLQKRFGDKTTLFTSSNFRGLPTLHRLYQLLPESKTVTATARVPFRLLRERFRERSYVSFQEEEQGSLSDLRKKVNSVSGELASLSTTIDAEVSRETERLYSDPEFSSLLSHCVEDIAASIGTEDENHVSRLPQNLSEFIRTNPRILARIIERISDYLNQSALDRHSLAVETIFSEEDLVHFEQWIEKKAGVYAREKKSTVHLQFVDTSPSMKRLEAALQGIPFSSMTTFYNLPTKGSLESQMFPTSWSRRGVWVLHWSRTAEIVRATAERLAFMASDEAPGALAKEPGVIEGLRLVESLATLRKTTDTTAQHYNRIRTVASGMDTTLPYFPNIHSFDSLGRDINALLLKNHAYDYVAKIASTTQTVQNFLQHIEAQVSGQIEAVSRIPDISGSSTDVTGFSKSAEATKQSISTVQKALATLSDQLQRHAVSSGRVRDFTRPIIPPTLSAEAELVSPVALNVDPSSDIPRLELDDLFGAYGLTFANSATEGTRD